MLRTTGFGILCAGVIGSIASAATLRVDVNASPGGDGSSWALAYKHLQDAIAAANIGDEIWVAEGTYYPDRDAPNPVGTGDRTSTFVLDRIVVLGGFPTGGGDGSPAARDPATYETILSGDLLQGAGLYSDNCGAGAGACDEENGTPGCDQVECCRAVCAIDPFCCDTLWDDTCVAQASQLSECDASPGPAFHVVTMGTTGTSPLDTVLDGVTILGGAADGSGDATSADGAGLYGALALFRVNRCKFQGNVASGLGGGFFVAGVEQQSDADVQFFNCEFVDNEAGAEGGGGYIGGNSDARLFNCLFAGNVTDSSPAFGGGLSLGGLGNTDDTVVAIEQCTFSSNHAVTYSGGLHISRKGQVEIYNSIFWGNSADGCPPYGGAAECLEAEQIGMQQSVQICCVSAIDIQHCDIEDLLIFDATGADNIDADPQFVDATSGDYRLSDGSPAIDAGDETFTDVASNADFFDFDSDGNASEPAPDLDLGNRVRYGEVDMGAYEYVTCLGDVDGDGAVGPADLAALLAAWGSNPGSDADFDQDGTVGPADLAALLAAWGDCDTGGGQTFQAYLLSIGLTNADWNAFLTGLGGSNAECWLCWMLHYMLECEPFCTSSCTMCNDPFGRH